jgi:hypothetical protein
MRPTLSFAFDVSVFLALIWFLITYPCLPGSLQETLAILRDNNEKIVLSRNTLQDLFGPLRSETIEDGLVTWTWRNTQEEFSRSELRKMTVQVIPAEPPLFVVEYLRSEALGWDAWRWRLSALLGLDSSEIKCYGEHQRFVITLKKSANDHSQ